MYRPKNKTRYKKATAQKGGCDENRMELLHHPGSLGHRDDPKAKAQGTGHPTRQGARRLRAPQGEFVPPGSMLSEARDLASRVKTEPPQTHALARAKKNENPAARRWSESVSAS